MLVTLIVAALISSIISGMIGMGGGILLLSIMSLFFSPATLIPLHGVVQMGSNTSRTLYLIRYVDKSIFLVFGVGAVLGALLGSQLVVAVPEGPYRVVMGLFILLMTWMPKIKSKIQVKGKYFYVGTVVSFLALFIGATGPIIAPFFLREGLSKEALVATKAICQSVIHTLKILVFGLTGFAFAPHLPLLVGMLLAVIVGNYIGKMLLGKMNDKLFVYLFKGIITLISIRMLYLGIQSWNVG